MIGGVVLVLVAILGFVGPIGPTAEDSIFNANWYFDNGENWAHLVLGVVALIAAYTLGAMAQKWLTVLVGLLGIVIGLWNLALPAEMPNFYGAGLQNPADTILHLVVGAWALLSAWMCKECGPKMG